MESYDQQRIHSRKPMTSRGSIGRSVSIATNFFRLNIKNLPAVYQYSIELLESNTSQSTKYDVAVSKPVFFNRNVFKRAVLSFLKGWDGRIAYDGRKIAYTSSEIPASVLEKELVVLCDKDGMAPQPDSNPATLQTIHVVMTHSASMDTKNLLNFSSASDTASTQALINALDVALSETNAWKYVHIGRTFFSPAGSKFLGDGVYAWRGFYQSVRPTERGLVVNLEESFKPFWQESSLAELCRSANRSELPHPQDEAGWKVIARKLQGVQVRAIHTGIRYRVHGFSTAGASRIYFQDGESGVRLSVTDYMEKQYQLCLRFPELPCVRTSTRKEIYIPVELLDVCPGQHCRKSMTAQQTSAMIRAAALRPSDRKQCLESTLRQANYVKDRICKSFGLTIEQRPLTVSARILPPPIMEYAPNSQTSPPQQVEVSNGTWNMQSSRFYAGATIANWIVLRIGHAMGERESQSFVSRLVQTARQCGLLIHNPSPPIYHVQPKNLGNTLLDIVGEEIDYLRKSKDKHGLQMMLVITEKQDSQIYRTIKRVCDLNCGVVSQCVVSKKIQMQRGGKLDQYLSNLTLKINAKLGGLNAKVAPYNERRAPNPSFLNKPHIVLGADVTHPGPGSGNASVAAVVGSRDKYGVQYTGSLRKQPARQEMITDMGDMFLEVYRRWYDYFNRRVHAQSIIMFRDGVSEGQYKQVLHVELSAIRRACHNVCRINPRITYVIVTKRHHARFFGESHTQRGDLDRNGNILPGTVIDSEVTSANVWEFYLNSHAGIQGTNRPSRYTVLVDENNLTADQLQSFVYRLTHAYARCTRSVSMVNAAYYAHLLAFRGRLYLGDSDCGTNSEDDSCHAKSNDIETQVHKNIENNLYFV